VVFDQSRNINQIGAQCSCGRKKSKGKEGTQKYGEGTVHPRESIWENREEKGGSRSFYYVRKAVASQLVLEERKRVKKPASSSKRTREKL